MRLWRRLLLRLRRGGEAVSEVGWMDGGWCGAGLTSEVGVVDGWWTVDGWWKVWLVIS